MNNKDAIAVAGRLEKYNAWRRGDDECEMGCTKQLGLDIDFAIKALQAKSTPDDRVNSVNIPEGYALVPLEPTCEMYTAGGTASDIYNEEAAICYKAMIAAATPPTQEDEDAK